MTSPTPPGWYPDPSSPGTQRWWDGTRWAAAPGGTPAVPPPPAYGPPGTPPPPSYGPPGHPGGPGGPVGPRRNRTTTFVIGAVAAVVVVAVVLVVALSGGGGGGANTTAVGRVQDDDVSVSIPRMKGWSTPDEDDPADQLLRRERCGQLPDWTATAAAGSASPSASPSRGAADDDDENDPSRMCNRGSITVDRRKGDDFADAVAEMKKRVRPTSSSGIVTANLVTDEGIKVDGRTAALLRYEIDVVPEKFGSESSRIIAQFIVIDAPDEDDYYPVVTTAVEPDLKAVLDTVREGIRIEAPTPGSS